MVQYFVAYGSKEASRRDTSVSFHSFPSDENLRKQWALSLRRENFQASKHSRLCSKHFTPEYFDTEAFGNSRKLKKGSVPSLFDFPEHLQCDSRKRKNPKDRAIASSELDEAEVSMPTSGVSSSTVRYTDNHIMDIKVEIKEEPNGTSLSEVKSEYVEFVSSHLLKECANDGEMFNKIQIKEEPCCSDSTSIGIKQEMELPCSVDANWKDEIKENDSQREMMTADVGAEESLMCLTESLCRNNNKSSSFFTSTDTGENSKQNIDSNNTEAKLLLSSSQPHLFVEPETNYTLDANVKGNLVQKNTPQHGLFSLLEPHNCEMCKMNFSNASALKDHKFIHRKVHICEICNKGFTKASALKRHKLIHDGKKPYTCEICNKSFNQTSTLTRHKLIHEGKKPHTCEMCKKSFTLRATLMKHKLLIHEGKAQHTCEICNKNFTNASSLTRHKLIHEGKKPHTCDICKKSFTLANHLIRHKFIHEGERPHGCEICNKKFVDTSTLRKHKLIHEGKKPHICEICNKSFADTSNLRRHKLFHDGKKPHTCVICNNSFSLRQTLIRHKLTHECKKLQTCEICNKSFTQASIFNEHKLTHENLTVVEVVR